MREFSLEINLQLDWSELDPYNHINNVAFFKYVQSSRINLLDTVGLLQHYEQNNKGPILLSCACRFKKPLHFPGNIRIRVKPEFIKNSSFGLHHAIFNDGGDIIAEAHDVIVMYDYNADQKMSIPREFRERIDQLFI